MKFKVGDKVLYVGPDWEAYEGHYGVIVKCKPGFNYNVNWYRIDWNKYVITTSEHMTELVNMKQHMRNHTLRNLLKE